ncbi:hypothetical protein [Kingella kingae]
MSDQQRAVMNPDEIKMMPNVRLHCYAE